MVWFQGTSCYHRTLSHLWGSAYQTDRLVGSAERTTAEELAETQASIWLGTSGCCLKSELTVSPAMEEEIEVAESVMFSGLKIEQEFPQRLTIRDAKSQSMLNWSPSQHRSTCPRLMYGTVLWSTAITEYIMSTLWCSYSKLMYFIKFSTDKNWFTVYRVQPGELDVLVCSPL